VTELGKILLVLGILMVVLGGVLLLAGTFSGKVPWVGRLPGDIHIERENWSFHFPLTTSIVISLVLTAILLFLGRR
jgi:uncharacterized membrane protein